MPLGAEYSANPELTYSLVQFASVCQFQNHSGFMFMQVSS